MKTQLSAMEFDAEHPVILLDFVLKPLRLSICATQNCRYGFFQGIMTLAKNFYRMKNSPISPFFHPKKVVNLSHILLTQSHNIAGICRIFYLTKNPSHII